MAAILSSGDEWYEDLVIIWKLSVGFDCFSCFNSNDDLD